MRNQELSEIIGRIATLLEYAVDEQDWTETQRALRMLDELYDEMVGNDTLDDE
jgi:hypothetical protein